MNKTLDEIAQAQRARAASLRRVAKMVAMVMMLIGFPVGLDSHQREQIQ